MPEFAEPVALPAERDPGCPFDPPPELDRLRDVRPVVRMTYPDGHVGWLVTGYAPARAVLADPRFSSRYELMHNPLAPTTDMPPAPLGDLTGIDPPDHTRYRRLLAGQFTVRRMRRLAARAEGLAAAHLDAMERHGPPVDLVTAYARPIPALMICELLGVPYDDHAFFQRQVATVMRLDAPEEERGAAYMAVVDYLHGLVVAKRAAPTDDLLGGLMSSDLTDDELAGLGAFLLGAGLDTTANMIGLGAFALLHPDRDGDRVAALHAAPDRTVEELLRYLTIAQTAARAALEDVELDGHLIRAGETVTVSLQAADRDPARFPGPDALDPARGATGHLAFGHGVHQCLGQHLARTELRAALPALFARFPRLRLAVPPEDVPLRTDMSIYGVHRLPVTWETS